MRKLILVFKKLKKKKTFIECMGPTGILKDKRGHSEQLGVVKSLQHKKLETRPWEAVRRTLLNRGYGF